MAEKPVRFNLDEALKEELNEHLKPWGSQKAVFSALAQWVCEVRRHDVHGMWIGAVMNGKHSPEDIIALGEAVRRG